MPKKRTKKQKARATYHYAYPAGKSFVKLASSDVGLTSSPTRVVQQQSVELYHYDPIFIRRDLAKTLVIASLMIGLELGVYLWL